MDLFTSQHQVSGDIFKFPEVDRQGRRGAACVRCFQKEKAKLLANVVSGPPQNTYQILHVALDMVRPSGNLVDGNLFR